MLKLKDKQKRLEVKIKRKLKKGMTAFSFTFIYFVDYVRFLKLKCKQKVTKICLIPLTKSSFGI